MPVHVIETWPNREIAEWEAYFSVQAVERRMASRASSGSRGRTFGGGS